MLKNLREATNKVLSSKEDVISYTIDDNNIVLILKGDDGKPFEGHIDFFKDGSCVTANFVGSPKTGIYGREIEDLIEVM